MHRTASLLELLVQTFHDHSDVLYITIWCHLTSCCFKQEFMLSTILTCCTSQSGAS